MTIMILIKSECIMCRFHLLLVLYEIRNSLMKYASNVHINKSQTSLQKRDNEKKQLNILKKRSD